MKIKSPDEVKQFYVAQCNNVVGKKLLKVRPLTDSELHIFGWDEYDGESAIVLIFEGGHALIPARDPELNGAGFLQDVTLGGK